MVLVPLADPVSPMLAERKEKISPFFHFFFLLLRGYYYSPIHPSDRVIGALMDQNGTATRMRLRGRYGGVVD